MPVFLLFVLVSSEALACRCPQRPLAEYFEKAQLVAVARLVDAADALGHDAQRTLRFELSTPLYKGPVEGTKGTERDELLVLSTAVSTAACGLQAIPDATYVLFAQSSGNAASELAVDSCSGLRVLLSAGTESPAGFLDVPPRFVPGQLLVLSGMEVLREVMSAAPRPRDPANLKLIGLLDLKALAHGGAVEVYAEPTTASPVISRVGSYSEVEAKEYGYEQLGAVVYTHQPGWYRIGLPANAFGWVRAADAGTWFPYRRLPLRRLAYVTAQWSGLLWPALGAGNPRRLSEPQEGRRSPLSVNVLEQADLAGTPWFRIEVLRSDPCSVAATAPESDRVRDSGWIPAYGRRGQPNVWFYSRGC